MKGKITLLAGLFLILAGLLWYTAALHEAARAAQAVKTVVPQLQQTVTTQLAQPEQEQVSKQKLLMTEYIVEGIGYIGVLEIPKLTLELPVICSWSSENAKKAPCRYTGSVYDHNMILCAHNYKSHFGRLNQLEVGDAVYFIDLEGNQYSYQVKGAQLLEGTDVERIQEGDWDLTLFTCTPGGKMRYSVQCKRAASDSCKGG